MGRELSLIDWKHSRGIRKDRSVEPESQGWSFLACQWKRVDVNADAPCCTCAKDKTEDDFQSPALTKQQVSLGLNSVAMERMQSGQAGASLVQASRISLKDALRSREAKN